jgi:hypothetical protein
MSSTHTSIPFLGNEISDSILVVLTVLRLMGTSTSKPQYFFTNHAQLGRSDMRWTISPYSSVDIETTPAGFSVLTAVSPWPYAAAAMLNSKLTCNYLKC